MAFSFGYTPSYRRRHRYPYALFDTSPLDNIIAPPTSRWFWDSDEEEQAYPYNQLCQLMHLVDGNDPTCKPQVRKNPEWHQVVDTHQYDEEDVKVSVDGHSVIVTAKHETTNGEDFDMIQMNRCFKVGQDVDLSKLKTKFWKGHLVMKAPKKDTKEERELAVECTDDAKSKAAVEKSNQEKSLSCVDPKDFKLSLNLSAFSPEDIKIKTSGNTVTVKAQKENTSDDHYSKMSFYRSFVLPDNVDAHSLKSKFDADGQLCITMSDQEEAKKENDASNKVGAEK
ncbi:unnamed protein product [Owenia fusiformis]|uniref:Uncharacterized protein n=1 Tax=Owenia fusiformis TaxID=6347 RepID=A0A8J1U0W6_OWEFU|nr:unnamed protein product [Owenia fusiformis]